MGKHIATWLQVEFDIFTNCPTLIEVQETFLIYKLLIQVINVWLHTLAEEFAHQAGDCSIKIPALHQQEKIVLWPKSNCTVERPYDWRADWLWTIISLSIINYGKISFYTIFYWRLFHLRLGSLLCILSVNWMLQFQMNTKMKKAIHWLVEWGSISGWL